MANVAKHKTVIDGVTYETETFPAGVAVNLSAEVLALAPSEAMRDGINLALRMVGTDEEKAEALDLIGEAKDILAENLPLLMRGLSRNAGGASDLFERLLAKTTTLTCIIDPAIAPAPGNVSDNFDEHFRGRLRHMLKVVGWVFSVGFEKL